MLISRRVQWTLVLLVSFLFIFVLMDLMVMPLYTRQGSERIVPDVRGLSKDAAVLALDSAGFMTIVETAKLAVRVMSDCVLEQRPLGGTLAKPGRKVHIVPALPAAPDKMPDLVGLDLRDAQLRCKNAGLVSGETEVSYGFSENTPHGRVISQRPAAGETVEAGSTVKLTVSLGRQPDRFLVPNLVDQPLSEVRVLLREAGLKLGKVVRRETALYDAGMVIAQSVKAGEEVDKGTAVDVVVAVKSRDDVESNREAD